MSHISKLSSFGLDDIMHPTIADFTHEFSLLSILVMYADIIIMLPNSFSLRIKSLTNTRKQQQTYGFFFSRLL